MRGRYKAGASYSSCWGPMMTLHLLLTLGTLTTKGCQPYKSEYHFLNIRFAQAAQPPIGMFCTRPQTILLLFNNPRDQVSWDERETQPSKTSAGVQQANLQPQQMFFSRSRQPFRTRSAAAAVARSPLKIQLIEERIKALDSPRTSYTSSGSGFWAAWPTTLNLNDQQTACMVQASLTLPKSYQSLFEPTGLQISCRDFYLFIYTVEDTYLEASLDSGTDILTLRRQRSHSWIRGWCDCCDHPVWGVFGFPPGQNQG